MITIYERKNISNNERNNNDYEMVEIRGLSTDTKPTKTGEKNIDNGSIFIEIDTGKLFFYDLSSQTWKEV